MTVVGLSDAVELACSDYHHTCARLSSGRVRCWGINTQGQLGAETADIFSAVTVAVSGLSDAVEIAAGSEHTCARRSSGVVVCWGDNGLGQLGDGIGGDSINPVAVSGLTDAVEIAAGSEHTCARRASGAVVCWGFNRDGEIGDGTSNSRAEVPVNVISACSCAPRAGP